MARDTSKEAADVATAFACVDEMAKGFEINPLEMKSQIIAAVARKANSPAQRQFVVDHCISLIEIAVETDEYVVARGLLQTAESISKKDRDLAQRVNGWLQKIEAGAQAFAGVEFAMSRLHVDPADPKANAVVGQHLCFAKGDFNRGLPLLKKGDESILAGLAGQDLANPPVSAEQLHMADAWWQFAESSEAATKNRIRARAHSWYCKAITTLTGLEKIRAQQRIEEFELTQYDLDAAIASGLNWLARQQEKDGRWTFACSSDPGKWKSSVAATGIGLLAFLDAGHTHLQGDYKLVVRKALVYLTNRIRVDANGGDLRDVDSNGMTAHALASLGICEAYVRTKDKRLQHPAQLALRFLLYAQDPSEGGWFNSPRSGGRTTHLGWPLMVLLAASESKFAVPLQSVRGVDAFLDLEQTDGGRTYRAKRTADPLPISTAIGLLARAQLTGHGRSPVIKDGIDRLAALPASNDPHFQFFAAVLFSRTDSELWKKWKPTVQRQLLRLQDRQGETKGSWFKGLSTASPLEASEIGRIGTTSLCLATLALTKQ
jgi:hypothetical protein